MGTLLALAGSLAGRIIGSHHLSNAAAPVQAALEGFGARFIAGAWGMAYLLNEDIHTATNGLIGAFAAALKSAIL